MVYFRMDRAKELKPVGARIRKLREAKGISQEDAATRQNEEMKKQHFPPGWDQERVQRLLAHYESQTEQEAVAEDEAAYAQRGLTMVEAPQRARAQGPAAHRGTLLPLACPQPAGREL